MRENKRLKYIGVKELGVLALPDFCPRCFWYERYFGFPPTPFPGIFNEIDKAAKEIVFLKLSREKKLPSWLKIENVVSLASLEEVGTVEVHHNRKYLVIHHKKSGWILRGNPDRIFKLRDNTLHIIDFKTAKFKENDNIYFPQYEIQLNGYYLLAHKIPVSRLSLIYCDPKYDPEVKSFSLDFDIKPIDIEIKPQKVFELLNLAREIVNRKTPPSARENCKGICYYIEKIKKYTS